MYRNPERLAWTVLLSAFFICCVLTVSTLAGGRWWLLYAALDQKITLNSSGTVQVIRPGRDTAEVNLTDIPVGSTLITDADSQATLTFAVPDSNEGLATITLYGNTEIRLEQADTPRFGVGANPNRINLNVASGRVRALISTVSSRAVVLRLFSPPDAVTLLTHPGSNASVEATVAQTIVTVREGEAVVSSQSRNEAIRVRGDQRTEVAINQPELTLLPAERNLVVNGDFRRPLEEGWVTEIRNTPNDITGTVSLVDISGGRQAANFARPGSNWGEVAITQEVNKDVRDFKSLRLQMDVRIKFQDLFNCGQQGSECPVMVKIKYIDVEGSTQEWIKGYFYRFTDNPGIVAPLVCVSCPPPTSNHERVAANQWQTVDSGNLLEIFQAAGAPAVTIKSITINGSGHSFDSEVTEVQLLASE